jgi:hypothetical protein
MKGHSGKQAGSDRAQRTSQARSRSEERNLGLEAEEKVMVDGWQMMGVLVDGEYDAPMKHQ